METAFGESFADVRLHTDWAATRLSEELNARAFTIDRDVAFGAAEYRPGTVVGDALIAHELAHVLQQRGNVARAALEGAVPDVGVLEDDADLAAAGAVVSLWGGMRGALKMLGKRGPPSPRSGLRLQRCAGGGERRTTPREPTEGRRDRYGKECPDTVEIGGLKPIPQPFQPQWLDRNCSGSRSGPNVCRTYLGTLSKMTVGPKSKYEACIVERLETVENTCGTQGTMGRVHGCNPHPGHCLLVNDPRLTGDHLSTVAFEPSPNAFIDLHTNGSQLNLLEGSGKRECTEKCRQHYYCGGKEIGRFIVERHYQADVVTKGGEKFEVTGGTISKVPDKS
jgi:hypothetical protein